MSEDHDVTLSEDDFFSWAVDQLSTLDEVIIISHTPIMFFEEEQVRSAKLYLNALRERFESGYLNTKYFMSYDDLRKNIIKSPTLLSRIVLMREWQYKWENKENVSVRVVSQGYFPKVSLWVGKQGDITQFTLIKMSFEDDKKMPPLWLRMKRNIPGVEEILVNLKQNSMSFTKYITKYIDSVDSMNDFV